MLSVLKKYKVETKVTFQKCSSISRTHCIIMQAKEPCQFDLVTFKPIVINDRPVTPADGVQKLNNLDKIQFPCTKCHLPHLYHLIIPQGSDAAKTEQIHFNSQVFKPILDKFPPESAHKLKVYLEMMQPDCKEPQQI